MTLKIKTKPKIIHGVPVRIGTVCSLNKHEEKLSFDDGYKTIYLPYIDGIQNDSLSNLIHYYLVEQLYENILDLSTHSRAFLSWIKWLQNNSIDPFIASRIPKLHPTRGFRNHLVERTKNNSVNTLASSTASTYINHIKNFYKFLGQMEIVDASEFFHKERSIVHGNILVETSDLSISRIDKRNTLNPLSDKEVVVFKNLLLQESIDFQLMCRFLIFSGLRLQEMLTLPRALFLSEILATSEGSLVRGLMIGKKINGVKTKFGKNRELFVSRNHYEDILDYLLDDNVEKRLQKWRTNYGGHQRHEPLFITKKGTTYTSGTFYSQWYRFVNRIRSSSQLPFKHKPHDCRATFGTSFIHVATKQCSMNVTEALGALQVWMGHSHVSTTAQYVKFIEQNKVSNIVAEVMDRFVHIASVFSSER